MSFMDNTEQQDTTDYVKFLLQGSGADVDFAQLRGELEKDSIYSASQNNSIVDHLKTPIYTHGKKNQSEYSFPASTPDFPHRILKSASPSPKPHTDQHLQTNLAILNQRYEQLESRHDSQFNKVLQVCGESSQRIKLLEAQLAGLKDLEPHPARPITPSQFQSSYNGTQTEEVGQTAASVEPEVHIDQLWKFNADLPHSRPSSPPKIVSIQAHIELPIKGRASPDNHHEYSEPNHRITKAHDEIRPTFDELSKHIAVTEMENELLRLELLSRPRRGLVIQPGEPDNLMTRDRIKRDKKLFHAKAKQQLERIKPDEYDKEVLQLISQTSAETQKQTLTSLVAHPIIEELRPTKIASPSLQNHSNHYQDSTNPIDPLLSEKHTENSAILLDACSKLGVSPSDFSHRIVKIIDSLSTIPHMQRFINDIISEVSPGSDPTETVRIVKGLKNKAINSGADLNYFIEEVKCIFGIKNELSTPELLKYIQSVKTKVDTEHMKKDIALKPVNETVAQQQIAHFRDLFEVRTNAGIPARMNELFVFWAEVNDGLLGIREKLRIDKDVLPGRLLQMVLERL